MAPGTGLDLGVEGMLTVGLAPKVGDFFFLDSTLVAMVDRYVGGPGGDILPIAEPPTLTLFAVSLVLLGFVMRQRRSI